MFDVGFSELLLIGLVALIVLGPERLPVAARMAGLWLGRLKRSFGNLKAEVERELGADEIRRQLHNERILDLEKELKQSVQTEPSRRPQRQAAAASESSTENASTPDHSPDKPAQP